MGKLNAPDPNKKIGEHVITLHTFDLVHSLISTVDLVAKRRHSEVLASYRALTGDRRSRVDYSLALAVVQGDVQSAWYECQGRAVPERCIQNQQERIRVAMSTEAITTETGTTKGNKTAKVADTIREGLKAGKDTAAIVAEVQEAFPESKADSRTVAYYRHQLRAQGVIAKRTKKGAE